MTADGMDASLSRQRASAGRRATCRLTRCRQAKPLGKPWNRPQAHPPMIKGVLRILSRLMLSMVCRGGAGPAGAMPKLSRTRRHPPHSMAHWKHKSCTLPSHVREQRWLPATPPLTACSGVAVLPAPRATRPHVPSPRPSLPLSPPTCCSRPCMRSTTRMAMSHRPLPRDRRLLHGRGQGAQGKSGVVHLRKKCAAGCIPT